MGILMLQDTPIMRIDDNGVIKVLRRELLPHAIMHYNLTFDQFISSFVNPRMLSISRTNAKALCAMMGVSQTNPYKQFLAVSGVSLKDSYWYKANDDDERKWANVNLYDNSLSKAMMYVALNGYTPSIEGKIETPEISTQGVAMKCWVREDEGLYLYKLGKKEIYASILLDYMEIPHIKYEEADQIKMLQLGVINGDTLERVNQLGEKFVKCKCMTTKHKGIVYFEDILEYCEYQGLNAYSIAEQFELYHWMNIADYIIGNTDRHISNWGFFVNSDTNNILEMHPLYDHDQAFNGEQALSQTVESKITMFEAAKRASSHLSEIHVSKWINRINEDDVIPDNYKQFVLDRINKLFGNKCPECGFNLLSTGECSNFNCKR